MRSRMNRGRPDSGITPRRTRGRKRPVSLTSKTSAPASSMTRITIGSLVEEEPAGWRSDCLADGQLHLSTVLLAEPELSRAALGEVTRLLEARHIGIIECSRGVNPAIHRLQRGTVKSYAPNCNLDAMVVRAERSSYESIKKLNDMHFLRIRLQGRRE